MLLWAVAALDMVKAVAVANYGIEIILPLSPVVAMPLLLVRVVQQTLL